MNSNTATDINYACVRSKVNALYIQHVPKLCVDIDVIQLSKSTQWLILGRYIPILKISNAIKFAYFSFIH